MTFSNDDDQTLKTSGLSTKALHGDSTLPYKEVAPSMSLTTTFRQPNPDEYALELNKGEWDPALPARDIYSRYTQPTLTRLEQALGAVIGMPTLVYPSGISAAFAILLHYTPDTIAIGGGYHGCHTAIEVYRKTRGAKNPVQVIGLDDPFPEGTLCWLETPLNPTGESRSIEFYAKKVHAVGGKISIDSTFAPPPLQDPFKWGGDIVFHSGTKYFAGHSDALCGTLSVRTVDEWRQLWHNRTYTGSSIGSMDAWLVLRSLRTLNLRILRQSASATSLALWLSSLTRAAPGTDLDGPAGVVEKVWHTNLQSGDWVGEGKQMTGGPACFAILLTKEFYASWLPHKLQLFVPATSLGGVESLIEQRLMSDPGADPRLIRISIGVEDAEDLKEDLKRGMRKVIEMEKGKVSKL